MKLLSCLVAEPAGIARYPRQVAILMVWLDGEQG